MKVNLLKNLVLGTFISAVLSGCGSDNNSSNYLADEPVQVNGDIVLNVNEDQGMVEQSLLDGVTNPNVNGTIFAAKFTYLKEDENSEPLYEGPALPLSGITKQGESFFVNTTLWQDLLAYEEKGVYKFTYLLDNGADELVERNIIVTVTGVEDKVEQITLSQGSEFKVAIDYPVQLTAHVLPIKATFKQVTWSSADESIATVDENGLVSGLQAGKSTTITATSKDGEVAATITAEVIAVPDSPTSVDIKLNGETISGNVIDLGEGSSAQLSYLLLPDGLGFDNEVEWESSNPNAVTVNSETGLITGIAKVEGSANIVARVKDSTVTQTITVNVTDNANLVYGADPGFESGELAPWLILNPATNKGTATVCAEAAFEGNYGLCLDSTLGKVSVYLDPTQVRQITFDKTKRYRFIMKARVTAGNQGGGAAFVRSTAGVQKDVFSDVSGKTWWFTTVANWVDVNVDFAGEDLADNIVDGEETGDIRIHFELQSPGKKIQVDNIQFYELP